MKGIQTTRAAEDQTFWRSLLLVEGAESSSKDLSEWGAVLARREAELAIGRELVSAMAPASAATYGAREVLDSAIRQFNEDSEAFSIRCRRRTRALESKNAQFERVIKAADADLNRIAGEIEALKSEAASATTDEEKARVREHGEAVKRDLAAWKAGSEERQRLQAALAW